MKLDNAVKSAISNYIATNRVDATSRDLTRLYATSSTAGACADLRAESVSSVPMRLKSRKTGELAEEDHPLNAIFGGRYAFQDTMRRSELSMYFWGRNLLQKNRNAFYLTRGLTWVNPNIYSLDTLHTSGLRGFRVYASSLYKIEPVSYIPLQDSVYMHEVDFDDDYEGVSPIERAFLEASGEVELAQTILAVFRNMAIPAAIAQPAQDSKPSEASRNNLVNTLKRMVQGTINAGRTIVSPDRWEWIQLQNPLKDQSLDIVAANARKSIAIASRVPLELIEPSAANYATFEGARRAWGNSWLVPRVKWYAAVFTEQLAREYGSDWEIVPDFDDVPFLKEDEAARVNVITAKLNATVITIGQARKELGDKTDPDPVLDTLYLVQGIPVPKSVLPTLWQYHFAPAQPPPTNGGFGAFGGGLGQTPAISGNNALAPVIEAQTPDLQLLPRPSETAIPALPAPASAAVSKEAALELKNWQIKAARKGRNVEFTPLHLPRIVRDYVQVALSDDDDLAEVFAVAREVLEADAVKAYQDTRAAFRTEVERLITAANESAVSRAAFGGGMRSALRRFGLMAFRDGMEEGGYSPESFSQDDLTIFRAWQAESSDYVTNIGASLFKDGQMPDPEYRSELWCNKSLDDIYFAGLRIGAPQRQVEWRLGQTEKHCGTCATRHGKSMSIDEWGKIGFPRDRRLDCGGWKCDCDLFDVKTGQRVGAR